MHHIDRRRALLGAAGFGGALLAGPGRVAFAAEPLRKVNIVSTSGALVVGQLMQNQKYLQEFGVDGNIVPVSDGNKALAALLSGDADIAVGTGFGQVLTAIEKGAKVKVVAGAGLVSDAAIYTKRSDIKSLKDLEGRTVGVGALGTVLHQLLSAMMKRRGVDPTKVNFVNVGSVVDVFRAVAAGTVDAGPGPWEMVPQLERYGLSMLPDGRLWAELPDFTNQATYTTEKVLAEKRDLVVRTLAAYGKLYRFIQEGDSQRAFVSARAELNAKDDPQAAASQWQFFRDSKMFLVGLVLSEQRVTFMQQLNVDSGAQKSLLPFGQITDMGPAQDAIKLVNG